MYQYEACSYEHSLTNPPDYTGPIERDQKKRRVRYTHSMKRQHTANFKAQVVQELLKEEKTIAQIAAEYEVHPTQLRQWKGIVVEGMPSLFEEKDLIAAVRAEYEERLNGFYGDIGRLTTQLTWLKKNLALNLSRNERLHLIERESGELSVRIQVELLSLNRSGVYYQAATTFTRRNPAQAPH